MESKSKTIKTWNTIARQYGAYRRKSWPAVADFLKGSQPVLDIGCGGASYLRKQDVGLDISFEMCKLASKNSETLCSDAIFLPIKPNSFSKIISVSTLHHLPTKKDRLAFLREIKRVLKPSGTALITCWYRWQAKHLPRAIFTQNVHKKWGKARRFYHLFSKGELAKLARQVFDKFEIWVESDASYKNMYLLIHK
jgi:SAM-dependent methyltransferase